MEIPTLHILINILLGVTIMLAVITALAFTFNKTTRNFGIYLGLTCIAVSIAQSLTQGFADFVSVSYWWIALIIAGIGLSLAIWSHIKLPERPQYNQEFWQQWRRAFWMLFGIMLVAGIIRSIF
jgi:hypothetical protein